ncbi:Nif3-like dinuclear metal center hexameric protein [Acidisarcina polymorpha]|nr:Nif3-like dinuclear metal center hexameric protein [Acidisarcina polymorpha]
MRLPARCLGLVLLAANLTAPAQQLTARQVIERIKQATGAESPAQTVDTFKGGDPEEKVTGIATTFLDTYAVLQQAAADGHNLIITHEPTFYTHTDDKSILGNDPVQAQKEAFVRDHHLVVWRFHDLWHLRNPDGILEGVTAKLGWEQFQVPGQPHLFKLPQQTLGDLETNLKQQLGAELFRVVGDRKMQVSRVALLPGASGEVKQVEFLERDDVEVLVAGEAAEWETVEYARDAIAEGRHKALILVGHEVSEEPGMEYCAKWLQGLFPGVPVEFLKAGSPFAAVPAHGSR